MTTSGLRYILPSGDTIFQDSPQVGQFREIVKIPNQPIWRYNCEEMVSGSLWIGGISPVRSESVLRYINISHVVNVKLMREKPLNTKFDGIFYEEKTIDDRDPSSRIVSRLSAIHSVIDIIQRLEGRVFLYQTVVLEDARVVVEVAAAVLNDEAIPYHHFLAFGDRHRIFNEANRLLRTYRCRKARTWVVYARRTGRLPDNIIDFIEGLCRANG